VLTDSGGVQEEAPIFGVPVLVMRENTERPEGIETGGMRIVGADTATIVYNAQMLLESREILSGMSGTMNPFGDGMASERTESAILDFFNIGKRLLEFVAK
jgi:UDP-N-acetylglucosamine 2-epimerase (non-hydrolysing)